MTGEKWCIASAGSDVYERHGWCGATITAEKIFKGQQVFQYARIARAYKVRLVCHAVCAQKRVQEESVCQEASWLVGSLVGSPRRFLDSCV